MTYTFALNTIVTALEENNVPYSMVSLKQFIQLYMEGYINGLGDVIEQTICNDDRVSPELVEALWIAGNDATEDYYCAYRMQSTKSLMKQFELEEIPF